MSEGMPEEGKIAGYNKKTLVTVLVVVVVVGAVFYAGAKYEKSKLSRLGLLNNKTEQAAKPKKQKDTAPKMVKFSDQDYFKTAYLISDATLSADAKKALTGFTMTKKVMPDGTTSIMLKALKPEYHDQTYSLKPGEQLYFIEKFLQDDATNEEKNINDDTAVIVDAAGNVVEAPRDFSK